MLKKLLFLSISMLFITSSAFAKKNSIFDDITLDGKKMYMCGNNIIFKTKSYKRRTMIVEKLIFSTSHLKKFIGDPLSFIDNEKKLKVEINRKLVNRSAKTLYDKQGKRLYKAYNCNILEVVTKKTLLLRSYSLAASGRNITLDIHPFRLRDKGKYIVYKKRERKGNTRIRRKFYFLRKDLQRKAGPLYRLQRRRRIIKITMKIYQESYDMRKREYGTGNYIRYNHYANIINVRRKSRNYDGSRRIRYKSIQITGRYLKIRRNRVIFAPNSDRRQGTYFEYSFTRNNFFDYLGSPRRFKRRYRRARIRIKIYRTKTRTSDNPAGTVTIKKHFAKIID